MSRRQYFEFSKIKDNDLMELINTVSKLEKIKIEEDAKNKIITLADGSARDALSMFEQLALDLTKMLIDKLLYMKTKSLKNLKILSLENSDKIIASEVDLIKMINIWQETYLKLKTFSDTIFYFQNAIFKILESAQSLDFTGLLTFLIFVMSTHRSSKAVYGLFTKLNIDNKK